jgi:hypothetical protein
VNSNVNKEENLKKIHMYRVLIQVISTIFTHQMSTIHVFRKVHSNAGINIFNCLPSLKNEKAQLKVALRRYLITNTPYSADDLFMYEDDPYCRYIFTNQS